MIKKRENNIYFLKLSCFLLLLIIFYLNYQKKVKNEICPNSLNQENESNLAPLIHNYKLFNSTENPLISLIIDFSNSSFSLINETFFDFIDYLSESFFNESQIIFLYSSFNYSHQNTSVNTFFINKKIKAIEFDSIDWVKNFLNLINIIKGKYFILINETIKICKNDIKNIYDITKGNIKNIIKINQQNTGFFYLIRTKILNDIIDTDIEIKNFYEVINYIKELAEPKLNYIHIAFCPNNYYCALTYTSMISILTTKSIYTFISFHLVIPLNFSLKNVQLIESLYEQFDYFNITFIKIDNRYENAYTNRYLTKSAFYRLSLGELLPNVNKIIYLDSDTICLKDLSNLYNLNFKGKIFIARIFTYNDGYLNFTVNTGVLLLNLIGMRKIQIEKKVLTLLNNGFKDPFFHDQAIINKFFKKYIGLLPLEYNSFTFDINKIKEKKRNFGKLYDFDSLYFSFKLASIIHYPGSPRDKIYNEEDWYFFARKSKYFNKRTHNLSNIFNYN